MLTKRNALSGLFLAMSLGLAAVQAQAEITLSSLAPGSLQASIPTLTLSTQIPAAVSSLTRSEFPSLTLLWALSEVWQGEWVNRLHAKVLHRDPTGYLNYVLLKSRRASGQNLPSSLEQEIQRVDSALHNAYLSWAVTEFKNRAEWSRQQLLFIRSMLDYIRTSSRDELAAQQNLNSFSQLCRSMSALSPRAIGHSGAGPENTFFAPGIMTTPGHRGALGSLLDALGNSSTTIQSDIEYWYLRQGFKRTFENAS